VPPFGWIAPVANGGDSPVGRCREVDDEIDATVVGTVLVPTTEDHLAVLSGCTRLSSREPERRQDRVEDGGHQLERWVEWRERILHERHSCHPRAPRSVPQPRLRAHRHAVRSGPARASACRSVAAFGAISGRPTERSEADHPASSPTARHGRKPAYIAPLRRRPDQILRLTHLWLSYPFGIMTA